MAQKGEVTIVEEVAIIRQRFRFQATWSRRGGDYDEAEFETAEEAVKWGRVRAPFVMLRTRSSAQDWSAGERDPEREAYGAILPRWPSQTETVGQREPDALTEYQGVVRVYEAPELVWRSERFTALWHEAGGPHWPSDSHFGLERFTTLYDAIDWGRARAKVVTVHWNDHPTPYAAGEEQADGQALPTWPPWPEPTPLTPPPGGDHFTSY
jgi:hypothetical protein